jgi:hypothetical protein
MTMATVTQSSFPLNHSISSGDVERWKREIAELETNIKELTHKRQILEKRIEAAQALFTLLDSSLETLPQAHSLDSPSQERRIVQHPLPTKVNVTAESSVISAVEAVITACELGISQPEIKDVLLQTPIGSTVISSDKGFYHAFPRLLDRGAIFKRNGRYFSAEGLARLKRLESQGMSDEAPVTSRSSLMGDNIMNFVQSKPGATSKEVIVDLERSRPPQLPPVNANGVYNVIARLVDQGIIEKRDGKLYPIEHIS